MKRLFDFCAALLALVVLAIPMAVIAAAGASHVAWTRSLLVEPGRDSQHYFQNAQVPHHAY